MRQLYLLLTGIFYCGVTVMASNYTGRTELSPFCASGTKAICQAKTIFGTVSDEAGEKLPSVAVYVKGTYTGTVTNDGGAYQLENIAVGSQIVFQYLGFEDYTHTVTIADFTQPLDIKLTEKANSLETVTIQAGAEDPAYPIIRAAIAARETNRDKRANFTADFYSRGIWRVEDAPEKILGQEVGDLGGGLDSTRTGVIYLSETISTIAVQQRPERFKETITASKVSGDDNGFSFNSAQQADFSFYDNTIDLNSNIVSPIADYALNYYRYELDDVFVSASGHTINKIKVVSRRPADTTFDGFIYIVDDSYEIYGTELITTGKQINVPVVKDLVFSQAFTYDAQLNEWIKRSQAIDFSFGFLGFNGNGRFTAVYSGHDFAPQFTKHTFTREVLKYEDDANKKQDEFWQRLRPVPLTEEESADYVLKDSIQERRESKVYLDSVDRVRNRFGLGDLLLGYNYSNSYKKFNVGFAPALQTIAYNTVQGWNLDTQVFLNKRWGQNDEKSLNLRTDLNYSFSDDRLRPFGTLRYRWNQITYPSLSLRAGVRTVQFNPSEPITPLLNTSFSLMAEENFMKLLEKREIALSYSEEVTNGVRLYATLGYEERVPLVNTTDQAWFPKDDRRLTPNDPFTNLAGVSSFVQHDMLRADLTLRFRFGQTYLTYPDRRFTQGTDKYPTLFLSYQGGINSSVDEYNFTELSAMLTQAFDIGNKGRFAYRVKGGTFLDSENISTVDYQHFNGNQTNVTDGGSYLNSFQVMPYYAYSTNEDYVEAHIEHDFQGWILGKVPGVNRLNWNLVAGAHLLATEQKPYFEANVGIDNIDIKNFPLLRIDYVHSMTSDRNFGAVVVGLKFLGLLGG